MLDGSSEVLSDVAIATNFGTKIAITSFVMCTTATKAIGYGGSLSGQPTECRYCRYLAPKGRCHCNHFWLSVGYNFGHVIASGAICDSTGGFSGSSYPIKTQPMSKF